MANSPRSMWSGAISLGLLNVPVTLAKATSETREESFKTLCADHLRPLNRNERCSVDEHNCSLAKVKGIDKGDGNFHRLSEVEVDAIEAASKSDTLDVLDVQPIFALPMEWATGNYFVRPNKKIAGADQVFALLVAALQETDLALVTKWGNASRERLAVIHAVDGLLTMTIIPFRADVRAPGDEEFRHHGVQVRAKEKELLATLLEQHSDPEGFQWQAYADAGLDARRKAVEAVINGEQPERQPEKAPELNGDLLALLNASVEQ